MSVIPHIGSQRSPAFLGKIMAATEGTVDRRQGFKAKIVEAELLIRCVETHDLRRDAR
jgi:hypothetical protein